MRFLIAILILVSSFSCKSTLQPKSTDSSCKADLIKQLQQLSKMIKVGEGNVYSFDKNEINVPPGYDTMRWWIEYDWFTGLDSTAVQYKIYAQSLEALVTTDCDIPLSPSDFVEYYGQPSHTVYTNSLAYRFNNTRNPNCYKKGETDILQFTDCSLIIFFFDEMDKLKEVNASSFFP